MSLVKITRTSIILLFDFKDRPIISLLSKNTPLGGLIIPPWLADLQVNYFGYPKIFRLFASCRISSAPNRSLITTISSYQFQSSSIDPPVVSRMLFLILDLVE